MARYFIDTEKERTMFYVDDFRTSKNALFFSNSQAVDNIISKNQVNKKVSPYSLVVAAKPLIHFASIFGSKFVSYEKNYVVSAKFFSKFYALFLIVTHVLVSMVLVKPLSWHETKSDVPLNILTKTFGMLSIVEAVYSVFATAIFNSKYYVELFNELANVDTHFNISKSVFRRRRLISIILVVLPIVQVFSTLFLRKFHIQNIGAHLNFFLIMLQGSLLYFIVINIYLRIVMLNTLMLSAVKNTMSRQKKIIFQDTVCDFVIKNIFIEPKVIQEEDLHCCWYELMQMYDKLADCIHLFNIMYCGQVFAMYNSWLLCTLLTICRSLSPSLTYSEIFLSDLFLYLCINCRPIFLATVCEMFTREKKKTSALLLHVLQLIEGDNQPFSQVKTMITLVAWRKLDITANVFTINVRTVMNFAGRIISYTVLMIQYFYSHVFLE